ncbi:uncharacterized protein LOC129606388 [Condylostylus longicornis]|uniref:uncharacterized protein LOC129606388 n=1 Tax=Condylostylus longicornis TaxID=2530218 RepID=UPI00244E1558|nr:uncharacterized protein LOC129606388 [Condylostylus longicornis]
MKQILFLYIITALKYPIYDYKWQLSRINEYYKKDNILLEKFSLQIPSKCEHFANQITFSEDFKHSINSFFGVKDIYYGNFKDSINRIIPVVIKYFGNDNINKIILENNESFHINHNQSNEVEIIENLKKMFLKQSHLEGTKFCSESKGIDRFIDLWNHNKSKLLKIIYLNNNIQLLLLPILQLANEKEISSSNNQRKYQIPKVYEICGNTMYQSYDGQLLLNYFNSSFELKLKITKQLIIGMEQFTEGISGFRIYLTDFNADNVVFNEETEEISFIDLDNVIIVDSTKILEVKSHTHEFIECLGCFAYIPEEICSAYISDLNYFAICQFLREDLYKNVKNGFLYPIPKKYHRKLMYLLDTCFNYSSMLKQKYASRYAIMKELLNEIDNIIM